MRLDLCGLGLGIQRCSDRARPFAPQALLAAQLRGKREVLDPALGFRDCFSIFDSSKFRDSCFSRSAKRAKCPVLKNAASTSELSRLPWAVVGLSFRLEPPLFLHLSCQANYGRRSQVDGRKILLGFVSRRCQTVLVWPSEEVMCPIKPTEHLGFAWIVTRAGVLYWHVSPTCPEP